jgi:hypothetical protein
VASPASRCRLTRRVPACAWPDDAVLADAVLADAVLADAVLADVGAGDGGWLVLAAVLSGLVMTPFYYALDCHSKAL